MGFILGLLNALSVSFENRAIREVKDKNSGLVNTIRFGVLTIFTAIVATIFSLWNAPNLFVWGVIFLTIIAEIITNTAYVKAFQYGEQSLVGPIFGTSILFLLPLEIIFLNEQVSIYGIVGVIIVALGVMTIGWGKSKNVFGILKQIFSNKGAVFMIVASLGAAFAIFFARIGIREINPILMAFFVALGLFVAHLPFVIKNRKKEEWKWTNRLLKVGALNGIGQIIQYIGISLIAGAYYISMKRFAVVFDVLIGKFIGKEEDFGKRIFGAVIVLIGIVLILIKG